MQTSIETKRASESSAPSAIFPFAPFNWYICLDDTSTFYCSASCIMDALKLKCSAVIKLFQNGQSPRNICCQLQSNGYKWDFIYCTLWHCHEARGVSDRLHTDQPCSVCTAKPVKNVKTWIRWNPQHSGWKLAIEMDTSYTTVCLSTEGESWVEAFEDVKDSSAQSMDQAFQKGKMSGCATTVCTWQNWIKFCFPMRGRSMWKLHETPKVALGVSFLCLLRIYGNSVMELPEVVNKMQMIQHLV